MIDATWPQVAVFGAFLIAVCFIGWCFFKYGLNTDIHIHYDSSGEGEKDIESDLKIQSR